MKVYKVTILNKDGSIFIENTVKENDWKNAKNKTWDLLISNGFSVDGKKAIAKAIK